MPLHFIGASPDPVIARSVQFEAPVAVGLQATRKESAKPTRGPLMEPYDAGEAIPTSRGSNADGAYKDLAARVSAVT